MEEGLEERYVAMRQNAAVSGGVMELIIDLFKYGKSCDEIIAAYQKESEVDRTEDFNGSGAARGPEQTSDTQTDNP